jgi:colanic acid biosynthesis glycosyl transferase WcaI
MKKRRILLIGSNFSPELTGIGKYSGEMMDWLAAQGNECSVITTYPYYPYWKIQEPYTGRSAWYRTEKKKSPWGYVVKVYRCPHYVPAELSGSKRMISDLSFFISAFFRLIPLLFHKKFDLIITIVPAFHLGLLAILYKTFRGGKFLYHIQDMQIEAAQELKMLKSERIFRLFYKLERFILKRADLISTISEGMCRKIRKKCRKKVILFQNWVDTKLFFPLKDLGNIRKEYGFGDRQKIILYSGAIGEKQGVEAILYSAKDLIHEPDVKFVICGSGPYKEKLIDMQKSLALDNVVFLPLQPPERFNGFLNMADLHLVLQKGNASDLVMPSKLTTILAIGGLSIVTAKKGTSLYDVVAEHDLGILVEPESQWELTHAIQSALYRKNEDLRNNARNYAINFLSIDRIIQKYLADIDELYRPPSSILR